MSRDRFPTMHGAFDPESNEPQDQTINWPLALAAMLLTALLCGLIPLALYLALAAGGA